MLQQIKLKLMTLALGISLLMAGLYGLGMMQGGSMVETAAESNTAVEIATDFLIQDDVRGWGDGRHWD